MLACATHASAGPWPQTQAQTLDGVSIGENASYALRELGLAPSRWKAAPAGSAQPQAEYRLALVDDNRAYLVLTFDTRIKAVSVSRYGTARSSIADPYGIKLNDSVSRLIRKRGQPTLVNAQHDYIYGSKTGIHWSYGTRDGTVASMTVSDGSPWVGAQ